MNNLRLDYLRKMVELKLDNIARSIPEVASPTKFKDRLFKDWQLRRNLLERLEGLEFAIDDLRIEETERLEKSKKNSR